MSVSLSAGGVLQRLHILIIIPKTNLSHRGGDLVVSVSLFLCLYFCIFNAANVSCCFGSLDQLGFKNK